jgi:hypothetical protein
MIFFELLEVAVFDLLHEGFALENVALEIGGQLAGHDEKLIVDDFGKRDRASRGNQMRAPLKHKADIRESAGEKKGYRSGESGAWGAKEWSGAIEEYSKAKDEKRCERNEKAVAEGRNAGPIGVTGNEKVKGEKGGKKRSAGAASPTPEDKKAGNGENKDRRPG